MPNPYKDADEDNSNSKRSSKPKVPTLNFTKVLTQAAGPETVTQGIGEAGAKNTSTSLFQSSLVGANNSMLPSAVSNTHKFMNA